jgi:hypothetical protein
MYSQIRKQYIGWLKVKLLYALYDATWNGLDLYILTLSLVQKMSFKPIKIFRKGSTRCGRKLRKSARTPRR